MHKILILLICFNSRLLICKSQQILDKDYSFLSADIEKETLHQNKDSFYIKNCRINSNDCVNGDEQSMKVVSSNEEGNYRIIRLNRIVSNQSFGSKNYFITIALKFLNSESIGLLEIGTDTTLDGFDYLCYNHDTLDTKFFCTYYSNTYLEKVKSFSSITNASDVEKILRFMDSSQCKEIISKYQNTKLVDHYAARLKGEIITQACINNGYNPIGAGLYMNQIKRKSR